jgi:hypothetical protein
MLARGAGADDDAVEPLLPDPIPQPREPLGGAEEVMDADEGGLGPAIGAGELVDADDPTELLGAPAEEESGPFAGAPPLARAPFGQFDPEP